MLGFERDMAHHHTKTQKIAKQLQETEADLLPFLKTLRGFKDAELAIQRRAHTQMLNSIMQDTPNVPSNEGEIPFVAENIDVHGDGIITWKSNTWQSDNATNY